MSAQSRTERLRQRLREIEADAFIVNRDIHCHYFSGFAGSNTALLISEQQQQLFTEAVT